MSQLFDLEHWTYFVRTNKKTAVTASYLSITRYFHNAAVISKSTAANYSNSHGLFNKVNDLRESYILSFSHTLATIHIVIDHFCTRTLMWRDLCNFSTTLFRMHCQFLQCPKIVSKNFIKNRTLNYTASRLYNYQWFDK